MVLTSQREPFLYRQRCDEYMSPNFSAAAPQEETVFGACRPGHRRHTPVDDPVDDWIQTMHQHGIGRVCCLLTDRQLTAYNSLLERYRDAFGSAAVRHAPVEDYTPVSAETWTDTILPYLRDADEHRDRVVVHCSAGSGRTGQVLALWLATERGYSIPDAVEIVSDRGRNPLEASGATLPYLEQVAEAGIH